MYDDNLGLYVQSLSNWGVPVQIANTNYSGSNFVGFDIWVASEYDSNAPV